MDNIEVDTNDALFGERVRLFQDFLESTSGETNHTDAIKSMLQKGAKRLIISLDEVRNWNKEFWSGLLNEPAEYLPACEKALSDTVNLVFDPALMPRAQGNDQSRYFVGFKGAFGAHQLSPKTIKASFLSKLVSIEGIVTKTSLVRPKLVRSVHFSDNKGQFYYREYSDQTLSFNPIASSAVYPTEDPDGNKLVTEYGYLTYKDHQTISIQEMPEKSDPGQLPRSVEIVLDDDLVDSVKPGDRIQAVGVYRTLGGGGGNGNNFFRTALIACAVYPVRSISSSTSTVQNITDVDFRNFNTTKKKSRLLEKMSQSLAPSIYGHDIIKQAVLLMLLGGVEKNLENGTHLRGDINVLMVGDPSTAKSQILRFVLSTALLAIATTGRGSSGVGLTAAVLTDKETGERKLEAGAMVLADRGIVCIDEFDKMSDIDRVAIHEVMEQQTVTIAKAGIHTSLNARCSVIAAANPVFGQYDVHKDPHQNIALPDSLLSRFDLLFVVTDDVTDSRDRKILEHVLKIHRYLPRGYAEGEPVREFEGLSLNTGDDPDQNPESSNQPTEVYEKFNPLLHGGALEYFLAKSNRNLKEVRLFSLPFIRKYIQYAKEKKPTLGSAAAEHIVKVYTALRNDAVKNNTRNTAPITARTLETLIRLATAHAKLRLSATVSVQDAEQAERILRFALFKEVIKTKHTKKRKVAKADDSDSDIETADEDEDEEMEDGLEDEPQRPSPEAEWEMVEQNQTMDKSVEMEDQQQENIEKQEPVLQQVDNRAPVAEESEISVSRLNVFSKIIAGLMKTELFDDESCATELLFEKVNEELPAEEQFSEEEFEQALEKMGERNQLMLAEGKVWVV